MPIPIIAKALLVTTTAGTTISATKRAYRRRATKRLFNDPEIAGSVPQEVISAKADEEEIDHFFSANSLSLGMTMGGLVYPPLMLASVPLSIYTTLPTIKEAIKEWRKEKRISSHTLESTLVVGTILTQHWVSASAIAWTYSFGRKVRGQLRNDFQQIIETAVQPPMVWTELEGSEIQMPINSIENGDIIVIHESSFVPLAGQITKGEALLNIYFSTMNTEPIKAKVGDLVPAMAFVVSGTISVQVTS